MKTLLISPMWLDAENGMLRHEKWLNFILPLKDRLGFDDVFFVDNASTPEKVNYIETHYPVKIHRCKLHISRKSMTHYGYWYSALAIAAKYAMDNGYEKILYIDTDMYPLSTKVCDYVRNVSSGWVGLWCPRHKFAETNFQIIGPDQLHNFYTHMTRDFLAYYPEGMAETCIPWSHIEASFTGDRYGEENNGLGIVQTPNMDYYGQCPVTQELRFNE